MIGHTFSHTQTKKGRSQPIPRQGQGYNNPRKYIIGALRPSTPDFVSVTVGFPTKPVRKAVPRVGKFQRTDGRRTVLNGLNRSEITWYYRRIVQNSRRQCTSTRSSRRDVSIPRENTPVFNVSIPTENTPVFGVLRGGKMCYPEPRWGGGSETELSEIHLPSLSKIV